jgi:hypothetical protein
VTHCRILVGEVRYSPLVRGQFQLRLPLLVLTSTRIRETTASVAMSNVLQITSLSATRDFAAMGSGQPMISSRVNRRPF